MKMDWPGIDGETQDAVALRGTKRDSMFVKADLLCRRTSHRFDIVVRNVSAGGLLADTPQDLEMGDQVIVNLRHVGDVPGRIVWLQPGRFGIAFDVTIDPAVVRKPVTVREPRPAMAPTAKARAGLTAAWPRGRRPIL